MGSFFSDSKKIKTKTDQKINKKRINLCLHSLFFFWIIINLDNDFQNQMQQQQQPHLYTKPYAHGVFGSWSKNSNVKLQLYVHSWLFCSPFLICISNFISNRFGIVWFRLPFSAFGALHGFDSNFFFIAKATDLRSILFSSRHYDDDADTHTLNTPYACIIFAFSIFIFGLFANKEEKNSLNRYHAKHDNHLITEKNKLKTRSTK